MNEVMDRIDDDPEFSGGGCSGPFHFPSRGLTSGIV